MAGLGDMEKCPRCKISDTPLSTKHDGLCLWCVTDYLTAENERLLHGIRVVGEAMQEDFEHAYCLLGELERGEDFREPTALRGGEEGK